MEQHLHIVCLDNPYPADYGGVIDMFYKLKALSQLNVKIHLHYFSYNERQNTEVLNQLCYSVNVYQRKKGIKGFDLNLPYIVSSRINKELSQNLNRDGYPILLEGLHCSGILPDINKNNRKIILRMHNDEESYYANLYKTEKNIFRKLYFAFEKMQLKKYQKTLPANIIYVCISETETILFKNQLNLKNTFQLSPFVAWEIVSIHEGIGDYCLYHANLGVAENDFAALWLANNVFSKIDIPLFIAGKNPTSRLRNAIKYFPNISLIANPSLSEVDELIRNAQINVLPSFTETGIKLKLLHALFEGRHCLANEMMIAGTGLEATCLISKDANQMIAEIESKFTVPFNEDDIEVRQKTLTTLYNNQLNAEKLIRLIY